MCIEENFIILFKELKNIKTLERYTMFLDINTKLYRNKNKMQF